MHVIPNYIHVYSYKHCDYERFNAAIDCKHYYTRSYNNNKYSIYLLS